MHKHLQVHIGHGVVYGLYLLQTEFARQDGTVESQCLQPSYLFRTARVTLRAGVQFAGPTVFSFPELSQHAHVLQQQGIDACLTQAFCHADSILQFRVVDDGVHRYVHPGTVAVCIVAQLAYVFVRVAGCSTCPETGCAYIDGIGSVAYRRHSTLQVLGRCQQFQCSHFFCILYFRKLW